MENFWEDRVRVDMITGDCRYVVTTWTEKPSGIMRYRLWERETKTRILTSDGKLLHDEPSVFRTLRSFGYETRICYCSDPCCLVFLDGDSIGIQAVDENIKILETGIYSPYDDPQQYNLHKESASRVREKAGWV